LSRNLAKKIQNPRSLENQTQRVWHAVRNRWRRFVRPARRGKAGQSRGLVKFVCTRTLPSCSADAGKGSDLLARSSWIRTSIRGFQRFCFTRGQGARQASGAMARRNRVRLPSDNCERLLPVVCVVFPRDGRVRVWIQLDLWGRVCHQSAEILCAILVAVAVIAETRSIAGILIVAGLDAQIVDGGVTCDQENGFTPGRRSGNRARNYRPTAARTPSELTAFASGTCGIATHPRGRV
jgi:hypothetical protein